MKLDDGVHTNERYERQVTEWREHHAERLRRPGGWLSVTGLHWLPEGESRFGNGADWEIPLGPADQPELVGTLVREGDRVSLRTEPGVPLLLGGEPAVDGPLGFDERGSSARLQLGNRFLYVIRRGERLGVRTYDDGSPTRERFAGLDWFPVDPSWRLVAEYREYPEPRPVRVLNIIGDLIDTTVPGEAVFTVGGREFRLLPTGTGERLFFVFRDLTSGSETYGAARFLTADAPADGRVVLDFNRAHNPPCAFTPHATCPLSLPENRLDLRVTAGERAYLPD